ncbi:MAG: 2-hydroxyglutaryl-CoA dehydratase [Deltaproteobacteria bacterium RBG_13_61_14]|nr:MAG: 2-hydroxyglutaryl-CoA dehydratase [Deltaproteobacteria bacterium RBG_13_61_14]
MLFAGIDVGSLSAKVILLDESRKVVGEAITLTGASSIKAAERSYAEALAQAGARREDVAVVVSTGYGRDRIPFAHKRVTEISCHAKGASALFPETRTVIDIGGQDSKVIRVDGNGRVQSFQMNDKCAAGTGRFLEVMARALEVELSEMGPLSRQSRNRMTVSSVCTVFAESEVVSLIASGAQREDIIRGIHAAIADRTRSLAGRVGIEPEVTMTGGVAKNAGVVAELSERLGLRLNLPEEPQTAGALGAALFACEQGMNK